MTEAAKTPGELAFDAAHPRGRGCMDTDTTWYSISHDQKCRWEAGAKAVAEHTRAPLLARIAELERDLKVIRSHCDHEWTRVAIMGFVGGSEVYDVCAKCGLKKDEQS